MEKLHLRIVVKSAQVFKNPTFFSSSKMRLYTVASVVETDSSSSPSSSSPLQTTMVDTHGGAQPFWWFPMEFQINQSKLQSKNVDLTLVLCIKCRRTALCPNKNVGLVHLPVNVLLEDYWLNSEGNCPKDSAFMILSRSGKPRGVVYLSYIFVGEQMNTSRPTLPPQPPHLVPSAPPLPEHEYIGYQEGGNCNSAPTATIPSAPYLPEENMLH